MEKSTLLTATMAVFKFSNTLLPTKYISIHYSSTLKHMDKNYGSKHYHMDTDTDIQSFVYRYSAVFVHVYAVVHLYVV